MGQIWKKWLATKTQITAKGLEQATARVRGPERRGKEPGGCLSDATPPCPVLVLLFPAVPTTLLSCPCSSSLLVVFARLCSPLLALASPCPPPPSSMNCQPSRRVCFLPSEHIPDCISLSAPRRHSFRYCSDPGCDRDVAYTGTNHCKLFPSSEAKTPTGQEAVPGVIMGDDGMLGHFVSAERTVWCMYGVLLCIDIHAESPTRLQQSEAEPTREGFQCSHSVTPGLGES